MILAWAFLIGTVSCDFKELDEAKMKLEVYNSALDTANKAYDSAKNATTSVAV